ncbi:MAG: dehalogenase [Dehalogenimonas sp.]
MWFWIGLFVGVIALLAYGLLRNRNIKLTWYQWLIGLVALASFAAAVQHYQGSILEHEPKAGWMGALIFVIVGLVFAAIDLALIMYSRRSLQKT